MSDKLNEHGKMNVVRCVDSKKKIQHASGNKEMINQNEGEKIKERVKQELIYNRATAHRRQCQKSLHGDLADPSCS
jgi:hypothetical protein